MPETVPDDFVPYIMKYKIRENVSKKTHFSRTHLRSSTRETVAGVRGNYYDIAKLFMYFFSYSFLKCFINVPSFVKFSVLLLREIQCTAPMQCETRVHDMGTMNYALMRRNI